MTGTGTQTDPYIVDNWADLVTALGTSGAYAAFPEGGGVINMNDIAPEGLSSQIAVNCAEVRGNGWEIRGLYALNCIVFYKSSGTTDIYDLDFLSTYIKANPARATLLSVDSGKLVFHSCRFSGELAGLSSSYSAEIAYANVYDMFEQCSFNFRCTGNCVPFRGYRSYPCLENSRVKLSGSCGAFSIYLDNSKLEGNIAMSGDLTVHSSSTASVINADISYSGGTFGTKFTGSSVNAVVINIDRISGASVTSDSLIQATTEQLTDAAYLAAKGFPIGVD